MIFCKEHAMSTASFLFTMIEVSAKSLMLLLHKLLANSILQIVRVSIAIKLLDTKILLCEEHAIYVPALVKEDTRDLMRLPHKRLHYKIPGNQRALIAIRLLDTSITFLQRTCNTQI
jgi:hypothetical protein